MSKLIIVCGLPGVGKTTLANELSKNLGIFCISKDSVKEAFFESMGFSTLEDSKKIGYPSVRVALRLTEENISRGVDVILESPFNFPEEGKVFEDWKKKYNIEFFAVVLEVDQEERKRRFTNRERHIAHHNTDRLRKDILEFCSYEHIPERKIFVKTDQSLENILTEVTTLLKS